MKSFDTSDINSPTLITSEVDFELNGKHTGYLRLPRSIHQSAYGFIPIPVVSIKNGSGPKVLLMAGNHGDEYEGQVALGNLARRLSPADIDGQIIILPMANYPAAAAGQRTSPIDGGNLNRSFPGDPDGTPTQMIAHYIESVLLERVDYLLDIHSGGTSLRYRPTLLLSIEGRATDHQLALLHSFGFDQAMLFPASPGGGYSSSAAERQGVNSITAEIAGGGNVETDALLALDRGLDGYLGQLGVVGKQDGPGFQATTRLLQIAGPENYLYSAEDGLFEPLVSLGEYVNQGQLAARIHHPQRPLQEPTQVRFTMAGEVVCLRALAQCIHGDCLFEIATPIAKR